MKYDKITAKDLKKGKKDFQVLFWITEGGNVYIKADGQKDAEKKLDAYLNTYSKDNNLDKIGGFDCSNREWEVLQSREV